MIFEVDPLDVIAVYNAGVSYAKQNLFEESIFYFGKVIEIELAELAAESEITNLQEPSDKI